MTDVLVTGSAGFIGMHVAKFLLERGYRVTGIDNHNDYYDVDLKQARLGELQHFPTYDHHVMDITNTSALIALFDARRPKYVVHLAAMAGIRYSQENPDLYARTNIMGMLSLLEAIRTFPVEHAVYASSSSVYGANTSIPFQETDRTDHPLSFYGATKKSAEIIASSYRSLYHLPLTGLRFFTVYGPWGRPDMAYFKFTRAILAGEEIEIYNQGNMARDFTYIDDIVDAVNGLLFKSPVEPIYNIGSQEPVRLLRMIELLEQCLGKKARLRMLPLQLGDMQETFASTALLARDTGIHSFTPFERGLPLFVAWYRSYYG